MKKLIMAALVVCAFAAIAQAQDAPVADVAVGYSSVYVVKGFTFFTNGGNGSAALNVNNWLGAVGDFGVYQAPSGVNGLTAETYLFGPRFSYRHWERFVPYAQVLVGGVHSSVVATGFTDVSNALAFGAGTGADFVLDRGGRFALRPQLEYLGFHANGSTIPNVRFSLGLVFRLGKRT